jgi:hypothetical protein
MIIKLILFLTLMAVIVPVTAFGASSRTSVRDDAASDRVIVRPDDGAAQDAIVRDKQNKMDASEDDAQNRRIPERTKDYTQIIPFFGGEDVPKIKKDLKTGKKEFVQKPIPQKYSGGFRVGPYDPSNLLGDSAGITYQEIYGNSPAMMIDLNSEYQFFKDFGKLGIKADMGIITAKGLGRFVHNYNPNIGQTSSLQLTFIGIPLVASLAYHLQFWDKQPVIPFVEGGVGYFTIFETRGDKQSIADAVKYGGSPIAQVAGGAQFMLDGLDKEVVWQLRKDYGISHIYLTADARQIFQLGGLFDFASLVFEGGILFEF